jgi:hypothetical protein
MPPGYGPATGEMGQVKIPTTLRKFDDLLNRMGSAALTMTRLNDRSYPVAATEIDNVFIEQNLAMLAISAAAAIQTKTPRATDVRAFLRREIESAYDVISQLFGANDPGSAALVARFEESVEIIARDIRNRDWYAVYRDYYQLIQFLPGLWQYIDRNPRGKPDPYDALINPTTILCYAIAVEVGLLDQQLRVDMKRVLGKEGVDCTEIDAMRFYSRYPVEGVEKKFEEYVTKRWPMITFALDPFVDEQNIADATSVRRDLQLALAFAFSSGQINFRQLLQFQRRLEFDAETIALNRTVSSFSAGDDTFGFRFTPRYQNPPPERTNFHVLYNQLIKGGPGRDYQINNSKLEPGQRELTVVVIMPSFLQTAQLDVTGNYFLLREPDKMKIPTARMIEQGRKVIELTQTLATVHDDRAYRAGDLRRLETRVHQLEAMLPMQTRTIKVPYENTMGGFQLFQQGVTSLVPQLDGFEGLDTLDVEKDAEIFLYGKHFSVQETQVVVGGKNLIALDLDVARSVDAAKASVDAAKAGNEAAQATLQVTMPMQAASQPDAQAKAAGANAADASGTKAAATPADKAAQAQDKSQAASHKLTQAANAHMDSLKKSLQAAQSKSAAAGNGATTPTNPAVDVISREVIRVSIPAGALITEVKDANAETTKTYVEVYVATPNGISNRLLIPARQGAVAKEPSRAAIGYTLDKDNLKITYTGTVIGHGQLQFDPDQSDKELKITLESDLGIAPKMIDAAFEATIAGDNQKTTFEVADLTEKGGVYTLKVQMLAEAIKRNNIEFGKILKNLDTNPTLPTTVYLTPKIRAAGAEFEAVRKKANGDLVLTIQLNLIPVPLNPAGVPTRIAAPPAPTPEGSPKNERRGPPGAAPVPAAPPPPRVPGPGGATSRKDDGLKRSSYIPPPRPSRSKSAGRQSPQPSRPATLSDRPPANP